MRCRLPGLCHDVLETAFSLGLSGVDALRVAAVSREFAGLARAHQDLQRPAMPPGGWPRKPCGPGQIHWRRRETYQGVPGLLVSWAAPVGAGVRASFMCVECGCWDDLEGDPWDERLADEDGNAITPRDAADARAWMRQPPLGEHWSNGSMRRYYASVLAAWPGDICRECYLAWDGAGVREFAGW